MKIVSLIVILGVFQVIFGGTLIGNGRWVHGESQIHWRLGQRWMAIVEERRIILSESGGFKHPKYGVRVVLAIRDLNPNEDFEAFVKRGFFGLKHIPFSVGVLSGFQLESNEPAGDLTYPQSISRFIFQSPCRSDQVFDVSVREWVVGSVHPHEYLGGLNCTNPIRDFSLELLAPH